MKSIFVIVYVSTLFVYGDGCGTSTHISIAHEASTFFKSPPNLNVNYADLIRKHQDAFVAGNPYPDAMYPSICFGGKYHQVAEDTHWAPFLNASINYIRKNYPQPWDEETEKLVAFVFGFVSHQVADVTWHSLGIRQGFLRTMAKENFHDVYDTAHTDGDVGGDMLTQFGKDDKPIGIFKWYVPVTDLHNIYKEYYHGNFTVPKIVIELCSKLLYIEYIAEHFGGAEIFKPFVKKSPFLLNRLHDYFLGGIHDMASWTTLIWNETAYMFEHGTKNCNLTDNSVFIKCKNKTNSEESRGEREKNPGRAYSLLTGGWNDSDVSTVKTRRGVYLYPGEMMEKFIFDKMGEKNKERITNLHSNNLKLPDWFFKCPYANTGKSLTVIKIKEKSHLVIGAPNYGEEGQPQLGIVYIIPFSKSSQRLEYNNEDIVVLKGPSRMSKFGWSVVSMLFNNDEYEDLAVSAPVLGAQNLQYYGKIFIYFGSKHGLSSTPNRTLHYFNQSKYTNFGHQLTKCRKSLLVSTPFDSQQKGLLQKVNGNKGGGDHMMMSGWQNYSWFGYSSECATTVSKENITLVGSPTYRKCYFPNCTYTKEDLQSIGAVSVFINNKKYLEIEGDANFGEFGSSISVGHPYGDGSSILAVSSPGKDIVRHIIGIPVTFVQAGEVTLYNLTTLLEQPTNIQASIIARYQGDRAYGRYGDVVKFVDVDGDGKDELIIASPRRSKDITEEFYGGEEGAVYIFKEPTLKSIKICFSKNDKMCQRDKAWKVFYGDEPHAMFGSAVEVITDTHGSTLFISAPRSSHGSFQGGSVYTFDIKE